MQEAGYLPMTGISYDYGRQPAGNNEWKFHQSMELHWSASNNFMLYIYSYLHRRLTQNSDSTIIIDVLVILSLVAYNVSLVSYQS